MLFTVALDAVLIALCWQAVFASVSGQALSLSAFCVLGMSVWLTYTADRLFDVANRPLEQLRSLRHRFTKQNAKTLWKIWFGTLAINLGIAFTGLTTQQLFNGGLLLIFCLLYTLLNQILSHRFFPKELCVALIYAAGVVVFLHPARSLRFPFGVLALLCLINCLIISSKERPIDAAMKVRSIAQFFPRLPLVLYACCLLGTTFLEVPWRLPFGASLTAIALVNYYQKRLTIESFRVLADTALVVGPILSLLVFAD